MSEIYDYPDAAKEIRELIGLFCEVYKDDMEYLDDPVEEAIKLLETIEK